MTNGLQIRLSDPAQYQSIVDAEWNIIYDKLQKCADSGAKVVLSRLAIGDLGTQFFADRDIFCAGRVRRLPCRCTLSLSQRQAYPSLFMICSDSQTGKGWAMLQYTSDCPPQNSILAGMLPMIE